MQIVSVREKDAFTPIAIEIGFDPDVSLLHELVSNSYPKHRDAFANKRGPGAIGEGIIDVYWQNEHQCNTCIRPGETGWLVLSENWATFYAGNRAWSEFEKVEDE